MSDKVEGLRRLAEHPNTPPEERAAAIAALVGLARGREVEQRSVVRALTTAHERMPEWIKPRPLTGDARYFAHPDGGGPHAKDVKAFAARMIRNDYWSSKRHPVMRRYCTSFNNRYADWLRDGFELESYSNHIKKIRVVLGKDKFDIYEDDGGWRPGPWWPRLLTMLCQWMAEADAYDAAEAARQAEKERQRKSEEDALYARYLRGQ